MRTEVKLSKRLERIASFVQPGSRVADIGTDHGYVPIWLVQKGVCPSALAMDVRKGPLERAEEHVEEVGLSGKIELRLSDGLAKLKAGEADTVVIAGMGGGLMQKILSGSPEFFEKNSCVVLQPQSEIEQFRRFLTEDGWCILEEDMVLEDGKYYPMMSVTKKETAMPLDNPYRNAKDIDFLYGAYLLKEGHPVLQDYLKREAQIYRELLEKLSAISDRPEIQKRIHEVEKKAEQTERAIQEMSK